MVDLYLWVKAFHIMAVIAWMAGLFYLPRLFVHHVERGRGNPDTVAIFEMMEEKLLRIIMNPAMITAWVLGISLILIIGPGLVLGSVWFWVKFAALVCMTTFHMWLAVRRKALKDGTDQTSGRLYRVMNEVPTILMLVIVIMVVVKPI